MSVDASRNRAPATPLLRSGEALFAVDAGQRVLTWNNGAVRLFGYPAALALGQQCFGLLACTDEHGRRFCRSNCPVIRALRTGAEPPPLQLRARMRGGDRVPIEVSTIGLSLGGVPGAVIHLCRPSHATSALRAGAPQRTSITNREEQVLAALCRGATTEEIALSLGVSPITVRNHVQHLLAKLAAHSRTEAVAMAYRDGLLR